MEYYRDKFKSFDTMSDYIEACKKDTPVDFQNDYMNDTNDKSWALGLSWKQIVSLTESGDISAVKDADKILDQIDASINKDGYINTWQSAIAGPIPNVPAYLANSPEAMLNMVKTRTAKKSVNIYYCPTCSMGIDAKEAFKRGVTVLALAMQLGRICDVNVFYFTALDHGNHVVRLTRPMKLSESAHVLTHPAFFRVMSYNYARHYSFGGHWANWYDYNDNDHNIKVIREMLKLSDNDIIIPPMHQYQWENGDLADPVNYINGMIERYR